MYFIPTKASMTAVRRSDDPAHRRNVAYASRYARSRPATALSIRDSQFPDRFPGPAPTALVPSPNAAHDPVMPIIKIRVKRGRHSPDVPSITDTNFSFFSLSSFFVVAKSSKTCQETVKMRTQRRCPFHNCGGCERF
jgi:hypothetical protein